MLTLLLFIVVMDVLREDIRDGSLLELYVDDLISCVGSVEKAMEKYGNSKAAVV